MLAAAIGYPPSSLSEFITGKRHRKAVLSSQLNSMRASIAAALLRQGLPSTEAQLDAADAAKEAAADAAASTGPISAVALQAAAEAALLAEQPPPRSCVALAGV